MKRSKNRLNIVSQIITLPFMAIALVILVQSLSGYGATNTALNKSNVQDIVEKYAIQCYASEGSYPPDLAYLVEHYGLILDEERYIYDYDIFASNIMPEIIIHDNLQNTLEP